MRPLRAVPPMILLLLFLGATPVVAAEGGELPRIVNFAILATILVLVLRKPLTGYLNARTDQIRSELQEARRKQETADVERKRAGELLATLDQEVQKAKEEARRAALNERERILKSAEEEARRIREMTKKEIDAEVEVGRRKLLERATELSVTLAQQKLRSTMTEADQKRIVDRSIELLGRRS